MGTLTIDLQEGFENDEVIIVVNGARVFHREGVHTKLVLGLADSAEVDVDPGPVAVEIRIPNRGVARTLQLDADPNAYLGISLENGDLKTVVAGEPFGYA